jgi:hypothetical protein
MSSNSNPMYLDFWPAVSKVWKLKFNIEPILIYVDEVDSNIDETYGQVIKLEPIPGISLIPQSQFARLWYLQFFPEDVCITSDIDMIPLSLGFFKTSIKNIDPDKYVVMSLTPTEISICYNIAKGKTFKDKLELKDDWRDQISILQEPQYQKNGQIDWGSDETYLGLKLKDKEYVRLVRQPGYCRIDRAHYRNGVWPYDIPQLKMGMYYDCHSIRPYKQYQKEINSLINHIL